MNAFDSEFWNVALKASIVIEKDLKKLFTEGNSGEKEGIGIAIARVREIKESIETLHGNSVIVSVNFVYKVKDTSLAKITGKEA